MIDIALILDPAELHFDLSLDGPDLATENGLGTAVWISLFTDRRALDDDRLPDDTGDRRGWWGDAFAETPGDLIGSRLWLLSREKLTSEVLKRAKDYAEEALSWLVGDGIASRVEITVERHDPSTLALRAVITRPDGRVHKYDYLWSAL